MTQRLPALSAVAMASLLVRPSDWPRVWPSSRMMRCQWMRISRVVGPRTPRPCSRCTLVVFCHSFDSLSKVVSTRSWCQARLSASACSDNSQMRSLPAWIWASTCCRQCCTSVDGTTTRVAVERYTFSTQTFFSAALRASVSSCPTAAGPSVQTCACQSPDARFRLQCPGEAPSPLLRRDGGRWLAGETLGLRRTRPSRSKMP
mmetsp:Transcript_17744/g.45447  ORF Transcript_17744/g.45447 Transcript_17744/m.45447 type:complete len:203 (+) Transcript_17744:1885-2493(+)